MAIDRGEKVISHEFENRIETQPEDLIAIFRGAEVSVQIINTTMILCHHALVEFIGGVTVTFQTLVESDRTP